MTKKEKKTQEQEIKDGEKLSEQTANTDSPEAEEVSEVDALKNQVAELNDKILRTLAELENTRRRTREEVEKMSKYAISKFATDLIPVMENFYLAMDNAPKEEFKVSEKLQNFHKGIEMTQAEMNKAFEKQGVKRIYPIGEEFNHDLHQAISKIPSDEKEGTVVDVLQAGYTINDRLLRPALVVVATAKE